RPRPRPSLRWLVGSEHEAERWPRAGRPRRSRRATPARAEGAGGRAPEMFPPGPISARPRGGPCPEARGRRSGRTRSFARGRTARVWFSRLGCSTKVAAWRSSPGVKSARSLVLGGEVLLGTIPREDVARVIIPKTRTLDVNPARPAVDT